MYLKFLKWAGLLLLLLQLFFILNVAFGGQQKIPVPQEDGVWPFLSFFINGIAGTVILLITEIADAVRRKKQAGKDGGK